MPLDNGRNRYSLHSLRLHCVLSRFLLDGEGTDKEERNTNFSFSTPKEITRGMKRIWESKMGSPSSERIIQDVDLAMKALEIGYRANKSTVKGLYDRNGHRQKVVGEGERVILGGAWTKGKGRKCKLTIKMLLHSDMLKFCLKKNTTLLISSLTPLF